MRMHCPLCVPLQCAVSYFLVDRLVTSFAAADQACQDRGATLAVVRSPSEMTRLIDTTAPWLGQVGAGGGAAPLPLPGRAGVDAGCRWRACLLWPCVSGCPPSAAAKLCSLPSITEALTTHCTNTCMLSDITHPFSLAAMATGRVAWLDGSCAWPGAAVGRRDVPKVGRSCTGHVHELHARRCTAACS